MNKPLDVIIQESTLEIRGQKVLLDQDVALIYGVETKRINEAVKNNPEKFPEGYLIQISKNEWVGLKSKFSTSKRGGKVKPPTAFSEKGLYMLATILKSPQATEATFTIIEPRRLGMARGSLPFRQPIGRHERVRGRQTFAKSASFRELSRHYRPQRKKLRKSRCCNAAANWFLSC